MSDDLDLGLRHEAPPDHRASRPHYGRRRVGMTLVALAVLAIIAGAGLVGVKAWHRFTAAPDDYSGSGAGKVVVQVHQGDTLSAIGTTLAQKGVVASVEAFTDAANADDRSTSIGPGFYQLHKQMKASLALALLLDPNSLLRSRVTIPEGARIDGAHGIFARITGASDIKEPALRAAAKNPAALGVPSWGTGHPLEGFLFPATYDFPPGTTATQALSAMVTRFNDEAESVDLVNGARQVGRSPYELLTLASIVEREGRLTEDYPQIAEVFYNRLRLGMALQSDAVLYYVLPFDNGPIRQSQLKLDSPYNLRTHPGLPPTPIASPGSLALKAVLHPAHGDYLYFVTIDKAGHTAFAKTNDQFNALVAESRRNGVE